MSVRGGEYACSVVAGRAPWWRTAGSYVGIRIQSRLPEEFLRRLLGVLAAGIGIGFAYALELL